MKNDSIKFKHGKYNFNVSTEKIKSDVLKVKLIDAIQNQFKAFSKVEDNEKCAIEFYFTEDINQFFLPENYDNIGQYCYKDNFIKFGNNEIPFVYEKSSDNHKVYVRISDNNNFKANCKILNKSFSTVVENQVSSFYYRIFLIMTQYVNLEHNSTYIHGASICKNDDDGLLFPADSGVGKSSMLFRMSNEKKYNYIADDLSIIDPEGFTYYSGRGISLKPYHLKNFPFLKDVLEKDMPKAQQFQWNVLKDNRLVFGMNPKTLFEGKTKEKAKLKNVIHLINTNDSEFKLQKIDSKTIAEASANILMNELFLGYFHIYKALAIPGNELFISPAEMFKKTSELYLELFNNCETHLLSVPYMSHPNKMYEYLLEKNILV